tara:strand:+ start:363 stop:2057 length:1695 start_codon:yes stop_codon:yes gene_type:complete
MRIITTFFAILLFLLAPISAAESNDDTWPSDFTQQWNIDFEAVYVSTRPVIIDESIYVRTSSSTIDNAVPTIYSLDFSGNQQWEVINPNSTKQDMSPILSVSAGNGECGNWPDMLLIGWSDGLFQALNPTNGNVIWQHNTEFLNWGITGKATLDEDSIIIPTRTGIDKLCLDGELDFSQKLGLGWRNSPIALNGEYWIGDESGTLWQVSVNQSVNSYSIGEGKIRHQPLIIDDDNLLIHLQLPSESELKLLDTTTGKLTTVAKLGPSPAMPETMNQYVITADASYLTLIDCLENCQVINQVPFTSNGEISIIFDEYIVLPHNSQEGGYGVFAISDEGELYQLDTLNFADDWYGTAGLSGHERNGQKQILVVNDNANLKFLSTDYVLTLDSSNADSDWTTIIAMLIALTLISTTSIQLLRERFQSAFKFFILFITILVYFSLGDIISAWADLVEDPDNSDPDDVWSENWPDEWLGTQVVIFEFKDGLTEVGGYLGQEDVLQLTKHATSEQGIDLEISDTSFGKYVVSIDGKSGDGWEYYVNGQAGTISAEYQSIDSNAVVVWKQL